MFGRVLNHYKVFDKIGQGGMGEVYRAQDTKLGREVALKLLPAEVTADLSRRERFLNEARALAALNHPNIVTIYSMEEALGLHFLTMEMVRGRSLGDMIPAAGMEEKQFFEIALSLTDALSAAHEVGVVHRDLKPSNLMLTHEGRVKVLDFGLATFVMRAPSGGAVWESEATDADTLPHLTIAGVIVGTMPYMSPEQIEAKTVDARSDIFSLGIILYEMISGRRPFHGDSGPGLMSSILKDIPAPVIQLNPGAPVDLGRIISRCLEKDPKRRFQTARDVNNEISALEGECRKMERTAAVAAVLGPSAPPTAIRLSNDIFISYAHLDNEAQLVGQQGWISAFHRSLEVRVGQLLGKKPSIWRSPKLHGDEDAEDQHREKIPQSALLISVLSPRYVKSEWCTRDLREFLDAAARSGGARWGSRYRVFKVVKTPTPVERHPPEIQQLLSYEFFKIDPETSRPRELDQIFGPEAQREYWARLDDLAHDIAEVLENTGVSADDAEASATATPGPSGHAAPSKGSIYLAPTSNDLKEEHDALRRDLQRHGYTILPDQPLPLVGSELTNFVREQLARSRMSIHLVGRNYGIVPEGGTKSLVELQNELGAERTAEAGFHHLIWISPGMEITDERQRRFVEFVRSNPGLSGGTDVLEVSLEDLKTVVHQVFDEADRRPALHADSAPQDGDITRVYLICDQRDREATAPLADFLFEKGLEVTLPIFEGDEGAVREDHEDNLLSCDAVLLYYGAGNELWLRRKLREVQKSAGLGRRRTLLAKGIWVAPPRTSDKDRLRTREAMVMTGSDHFTPGPLEPFVTAVAGTT